ncbi:MAG TPA: hypothetical protein VF733_04275 [Candidatus Saccharimonadales bacterium]
MSAVSIYGVEKFPPVAGWLFDEPVAEGLSPDGARLSAEVDDFLKDHHQFLWYRMSDPDLRLPQFDASVNSVFAKENRTDAEITHELTEVFGTSLPDLYHAMPGIRGDLYTDASDMPAVTEQESQINFQPDRQASEFFGQEINVAAPAIQELIPQKTTQHLGSCMLSEPVTFRDLATIDLPFSGTLSSSRDQNTFDYLRDDLPAAHSATTIPYFFGVAEAQTPSSSETRTLRVKLTAVTSEFSQLLEGKGARAYYGEESDRSEASSAEPVEAVLSADLNHEPPVVNIDTAWELLQAQGIIDTVNTPLFGGEAAQLFGKPAMSA